MFESTLQDLPWTAILLLIAIALLAYRNILTGVRLKTLKQAIDQHAIYSRTDAKGVIRDVNTNFEKVSGYNRDELIGQDHRMLNSGYHEGTFFDRMWETITSGNPWGGIIRNRTKTGGHYWVKSTIVPESNLFGKIIGYASLRTEMTDIKKRGDAALEVLELLDFVEDEIVVFDPGSRRVVYANRVAREANGVEADELKNCSIARFGLERDPEVLDARLAELAAGENDRSKHATRVAPTEQNARERTFQHRMTSHRNERGEMRIVAVTRDISARSRLQAEVQRMGEMIETSKVPVISFNGKNGAVTYFNQAILDLYGYTRAEFRSLTVAQMRSKKATAADVYNGLEANRDPVSGIVAYEVAHRRKDGSEFICSVNLSSFENLDGSIDYFGTFVDATEQHNTQKHLARLTSALDALDDEIYLMDAESLKYLYLNKKARKRLPDETIDYSELTHSDIFQSAFKLERYRAVVQSLLGGEIGVSILDRSLPGIPFAEIVTQLLSNDDATPIVINQIRDISQRVAFESEAAQLQAAIESSEDIVFVFDPETLEIDYINGSGMTRLKISENESERVLDGCFETLAKEDYQRIAAELGADTSQSRTVETRDANGIFYEVKFQAINSDMGLTMIGVARDISFRKELENNKKRFISAVTHELRTPVTSIKGALGILATGALENNPQAATDLAKIADTTSDKLIRLINDIVDLEKIDSGKFEVQLEPLDLCEVVHEAIEQNVHYAKQFNIELQLFGCDEVLPVLGDRLRLNQIIDNLVSNAAKFSEGAPEVHIAVARQDGNCQIIVRDFGKGIPEEARERIFDSFQQLGQNTSGKVRGSGLGLSIVKELVVKHNGTIHVESVLGEGTDFVVTLPLEETVPA